MSDTDLFEIPEEGRRSRDERTSAHSPLAVRMRPASLDEVVGQDHLLAPDKLLRRTLKADRLVSAIFYGPPGTGKTTLARLISKATDAVFQSINAVASNVQEMRRLIEGAHKRYPDKRTVLFIDEIHRFNKSQQDILMPDVENGVIILVGATTHNPAFSINGPLLSRALIFELRPLEEADILKLLKRSLKDDKRGMGALNVRTEKGALEHVVRASSGDARKALNSLEVGIVTTPPDKDGVIQFTREVAEQSCQRRIVYYDRDEDYHYDTISAFIKSIRGSDPDAALYWLAKMLYAGEDPRFILRRLVILASEDIGNADPQALVLAQSSLQAVEFVGMPEGRIILGQLVTYLSLAAKSNASYRAIEKALGDVEKGKRQEVPAHLRDTHYKTAKRLGHGEGYKYPHDYAGHYVVQNYMTDPKKYYEPAPIGYEKTLLERLKRIEEKRRTTP